MKPVWVKKPNYLKINSAYSPKGIKGLSGVVWVLDGCRGYSHISIDFKSVEKLGKHMPQGIGPQDQCYLKVMKYLDNYRIFCCYVNQPGQILLWEQKYLPCWVKRVKYRKGK